MNAQISAQPATPLSANLRTSFRTAVARMVRLTALGITAVVTALWLQSGGITGATLTSQAYLQSLQSALGSASGGSGSSSA
jgi:uncharacterized protein with FMN-binding domain